MGPKHSAPSNSGNVVKDNTSNNSSIGSAINAVVNGVRSANTLVNNPTITTPYATTRPVTTGPVYPFYVYVSSSTDKTHFPVGTKLSIYGNDPNNANYDIVRDENLNPYNVPIVGAHGTRIKSRYNGPGTYQIFYYNSYGIETPTSTITFSSTVPTTAPVTTTPYATTKPVTTTPYATTKPVTTTPYATTKPVTTTPYATTAPVTTTPYATTKPVTTTPYATTAPANKNTLNTYIVIESNTSYMNAGKIIKIGNYIDKRKYTEIQDENNNPIKVQISFMSDVKDRINLVGSFNGDGEYTLFYYKNTTDDKYDRKTNYGKIKLKLYDPNQLYVITKSNNTLLPVGKTLQIGKYNNGSTELIGIKDNNSKPLYLVGVFNYDKEYIVKSSTPIAKITIEKYTGGNTITPIVTTSSSKNTTAAATTTTTPNSETKNELYLVTYSNTSDLLVGKIVNVVIRKYNPNAIWLYDYTELTNEKSKDNLQLYLKGILTDNKNNNSTYQLYKSKNNQLQKVGNVSIEKYTGGNTTNPSVNTSSSKNTTPAPTSYSNAYSQTTKPYNPTTTPAVTTKPYNPTTTPAMTSIPYNTTTTPVVTSKPPPSNDLQFYRCEPGQNDKLQCHPYN